MNKLMIILLSAAMLAGCSTQLPKQRSVACPSFGEDRETKESQRLIIYNASITLEVKNPDSTNNHLADIAMKYGGYVQTLGNKKSIIRVKTDKLNFALTDISEMGKVKSKSVSGDDVTDQYTDFQIRLVNANRARDRYLELLAKAENVEAALKVEKELERLNGEIDQLEGRMKRLKHLSDYSTITITINERVKPGILGYIGIALYKSVKWLIVRN